MNADVDFANETWSKPYASIRAWPDLGKSIYLYAIRNGDRAVKFGIAKDVKRRLKSLCGATCDKLSLVASLYVKGGADDLEKRLHVSLARFRIRGEWFLIRPQTLKVIELMNAKDYEGIEAFIHQQRNWTIELKSIEPTFPNTFDLIAKL